jgi:hypothetical protein
MRALFFALVGFACCMPLAGCFDSSPKLSKEDQQLFDAVMYAFTGIEDNTRDSNGLTSWQKEPTANGFRFTKIAKNGIFSSDPELNTKMRQSKYLKYVYRLTSKERCVFRFEDFDEFSKGESQTEFAPIEGHGNNILNSATFNFGNAHKFEFVDSDWGTPIIVLEGPKVVCQEEIGGVCENRWTSENSGMAYTRFNGDEESGREESVRRRGRAIELIKKACPGKAF